MHRAPAQPIMIAMSPERSSHRANADHRWIPAWQIAAIWLIPTLLSTAETVIFAAQAGRPIPAWRAFIGEAPQWLGWALLTPGILALAERFPLRRPLEAVSVAVHVLASLIAGVLLALADALVNAWARP
ncbi:MAG TPA: hypothetical protein VG868_08545, partial [Casimicrobiaceae bacterium]|nr:hypothetical protein [Casimicrobiaceae bacterium]